MNSLERSKKYKSKEGTFTSQQSFQAILAIALLVSVNETFAYANQSLLGFL